METYSFWIEMAGTVAFAVSAVLAVSPKGIDLFGASVLGIITAVGGGTLRDIILDVPVFWSEQQIYIWVGFGASIIAFYGRALFKRKYINNTVKYVDAIGVSLFAIQAVDKVWNLHFGLPVGPVILGITTAIGGGLIRDVLAGRQNLLMTKELYAIPVMLGCTIYVFILVYVPEYRVISSTACILFIFIMRSASIKWNLTVPELFLIKADNT
jgi:uncharacterized membrane protein YeiH